MILIWHINLLIWNLTKKIWRGANTFLQGSILTTVNLCSRTGLHMKCCLAEANTQPHKGTQSWLWLILDLRSLQQTFIFPVISMLTTWHLPHLFLNLSPSPPPPSFFPTLPLCVSLSPLLLWLSGVFPRDKTLAHFTHEESAVGKGSICMRVCARIYLCLWPCAGMCVCMTLHAYVCVESWRKREQVRTHSKFSPLEAAS